MVQSALWCLFSVIISIIIFIEVGCVHVCTRPYKRNSTYKYSKVCVCVNALCGHIFNSTNINVQSTYYKIIIMWHVLCAYARGRAHTSTQTTVVLTVCAWFKCNMRIVVTMMVKFNVYKVIGFIHITESRIEEEKKMIPFVSKGSQFFFLFDEK